MTLVGVLLITADAAVVADLERWGIRRTIALGPGAPIEETLARRVKGEEAVIFASPRRRWSDVMEAVRAAAGVVGGGLSLRFYQPTCTIDVRSPVTSAPDTGFAIFPTVAEYENGLGSKAYSVRKAVAAGVKDLEQDARERWRQDFLRKAAALERRKAA